MFHLSFLIHSGKAATRLSADGRLLVEPREGVADSNSGENASKSKKRSRVDNADDDDDDDDEEYADNSRKAKQDARVRQRGETKQAVVWMTRAL